MSEHEDAPAASGAQNVEHEISGYPVNHIAAVIDTHDRAMSAVEALKADAFPTTGIHVLAGADAAAALDATSGRTGLAGLAVRIAERLGVENDEMMLKEWYEQQLRDGHYLLLVDAEDDARKERASQILIAHGAHGVSYLGRLTMEKIVPRAAR
ncbi:MAG TPA: hypothetical protein VHQ45_08280 [Gemmatimonadaceae bacterium]|jgi:hypothetical protein|nr:hypothetical protein [Gemmatimonadaceae bacterium]